MKTTKLICGFSILLLSALPTHAQSFQNLKFEQANPFYIGNQDYPVVTISSAVPDWTVYSTVDSYGDYSQQTTCFYGTISLGGTGLTLIGPATPSNEATAIDGHYSVFLQTYAPNNWVSISQTGLIPSGTQSLIFEATGGEVPFLSVQIGTQTVPFSAIGSGANYTLFAANISAWAGDVEPLTFTAYSSGYPDSWELDDISFSPTAVPEPRTLALSGLGAMIFGARKWLARRD